MYKRHRPFVPVMYMFIHTEWGSEIRSQLVTHAETPDARCEVMSCPLVIGSPRTHINAGINSLIYDNAARQGCRCFIKGEGRIKRGSSC